MFGLWTRLVFYSGKIYRTLSLTPEQNMLELPCIGFRYNGPSVCMRDGGDGSRITPHVSPHCHHMKNCLFVRRVHASRYQILSHTAFPYFCFSDYVPFSWHPSNPTIHIHSRQIRPWEKRATKLRPSLHVSAEWECSVVQTTILSCCSGLRKERSPTTYPSNFLRLSF